MWVELVGSHLLVVGFFFPEYSSFPPFWKTSILVVVVHNWIVPIYCLKMFFFYLLLAKHYWSNLGWISWFQDWTKSIRYVWSGKSGIFITRQFLYNRKSIFVHVRYIKWKMQYHNNTLLTVVDGFRSPSLRYSYVHYIVYLQCFWTKPQECLFPLV